MSIYQVVLRRTSDLSVDGWKDGCGLGWLDGRVVGCLYPCILKWLDGWMLGCLDA